MKKLFTAQQKTAAQYAGLASVATALVSIAVTQMMTIELNFWALLSLLVVGIAVFVYIDLKGKKGV